VLVRVISVKSSSRWRGFAGGADCFAESGLLKFGFFCLVIRCFSAGLPLREVAYYFCSSYYLLAALDLAITLGIPSDARLKMQRAFS